MDGLYVDTHHCLRIVTRDWVVYTASKDDGWVGWMRLTTQTSNKWVTLETEKTACQGVFNGADCILWEDGDKWNRLHVSYAQWDMMTRRPYVPMSFMFASSLYDLMCWVFALVRGVMKK